MSNLRTDAARNVAFALVDGPFLPEDILDLQEEGLLPLVPWTSDELQKIVHLAKKIAKDAKKVGAL